MLHFEVKPDLIGEGRLINVETRDIVWSDSQLDSENQYALFFTRFGTTLRKEASRGSALLAGPLFSRGERDCIVKVGLMSNGSWLCAMRRGWCASCTWTSCVAAAKASPARCSTVGGFSAGAGTWLSISSWRCVQALNPDRKEALRLPTLPPRLLSPHWPARSSSPALRPSAY